MTISTNSDFYGSVVVAGTQTVIFSNATIESLSFTNYGSSPSLVHLVAGYLQLASPSPLTIPGNVTVHEQLTLIGQYHITGYLLQYSGNVNMQGTDPQLQVDSAINLFTPSDQKLAPPQFNSNGVISTPLLTISAQAVFTIAAEAGFVVCAADIASSGILYVPSGELLYINGTFTMAQDSVVRVTGLLSSTTPRLQIEEMAYLIGGVVEYTIEGEPEKSSPYLVIMAEGGLHGNFDGSSPKDMTDKTKGDLVFESNKVYIKFAGEAHHHGMPWYGWFLIIIGIGSISGFVYLYYRGKRLQRERRGYDRVEM